MNSLKSLLFGAVILLTGCCPRHQGATDLRCEMLRDPGGMGSIHPRLSWVLAREQGPGARQTAYRILVASSPQRLESGEGDLWDSGVVASDSSVLVMYRGRPLTSRQRCYWKVKVTTCQGELPWSRPACWSMGLLGDAPWQAEWVGLDRSFAWEAPEAPHTRLAARYFRREFFSELPVRRATVYVSGLGLYELYMNADRIGDSELAPAPTDYEKCVYYNTYDVTSFVREGRNALGAVVGNGRFFSMRRRPGYYAPGEHWLYHNRHYGFPKLLLQLEIEYEDGSTRLVCTDPSWKVTADGPIRSNSEFDGETYDATREMPGWNEPSYDDSAWLDVDATDAPGGRLEAQPLPPIRVMDTLRPIAVTEPQPGVYILDMGQNMVGRLRMRVCGGRGDTVTLRFAERLRPDGGLYMDNIREAEVTDRYVLRGGGEETWAPSFTYHGFRYAEVRGYPGKFLPEHFVGHVLHDDMEVTGEFRCSDSTINQIYRNAYWGIRGNYRGMPTDCPQRDERMGWLGDRSAGAQGECYLFGVRHLYAKWLDDIQRTQRPDGSLSDIAPNYWDSYTDNMTWPASYLIVARMLYRQYGDLEPIARHYASMKRWLDYMAARHMRDGIVTRDQFGDWCMPPDRPEDVDAPSPSRITDGLLLGTAYYHYLSQLMAEFAALLGKPADSADFATRAGRVRKAFNERFYNSAEGYYGNNTVTTNLVALGCGLVPPEAERRVFAHAAHKTEHEFGGHVGVGLIGMQWIMRTFSEYGRPDLALRMATARDYPGWGYMIEQGATTVWELWNSNLGNPAMNSHNHVMLLGDLIPWLYQYLAGIRNDPASCGFRRIVLKPYPLEPLTWVRASYRSPYGPVTSHWRRDGKSLDWEISVPNNTTATVWVPASCAASVRSDDHTGGLSFGRMEGGYAVFEALPGDYRIESTI